MCPCPACDELVVELLPEKGRRTSDVPVADVRSPAVGSENGTQGRGQLGEVAVVDATVVELAGELGEQPGPVPAGRRGWHADFHVSFHHVDRGSSGGRRPCLFPGAMPAGGRTPLRDRPPASWSDGSTAPTTGRRRGPSFGTVHVRCGRV